MILLGMWGRNYVNGKVVCFPANAWVWYTENIEQFLAYFDGFQCPPASITQSGNAPDGDGYGVRIYRVLDGTYWGNKSDLVAFSKKVHENKKKLAGDAPWRQQDGEEAPGVFPLKGTGKFSGSTTASWFQFFGQPGEKLAPKGTPASDLIHYFVPQDDIPDTDGNWPDGRIPSFQHCIPEGIVEENVKDIYAGWVEDVGYDLMRKDEAKAIHVQSMARIVRSQPKVQAYVEYDDGNLSTVMNYLTSEPMSGCAAAEDYPFYWHLQSACNGFNAKLLAKDGFWGLFQHRPDLAILFFGNPDVTSSRGVDNGISEQIVFNLASAAAITIPLPAKAVIVDAQAYFTASKTFPNCYGLEAIINNICWFAKMFAIGKWQVRWLDVDVVAYTRDGDGGSQGWSGGCMVVVNFNTFAQRTLILQSMWADGKWIYDYAHIGGATSRNFTVYDGGKVALTMKSNAFSSGTAFSLLAPGGVS